ncbi:MAG: alpha/beta fold hydrolase [Pseudomonadota bacterium]
MSRKRTIRQSVIVVLACLAAGWALWVLEGARAGLSYEALSVGTTPVKKISDGSGGPDVVLAHGFAGSQQMMLGYADHLARAGYTVFTFDFEGHGRNTVPMSGDVTAEDGTTRLLVDQTLAVIDAARGSQDPVALVGHSMATDVLVRAALERPDTGPLVLLATFSGAVTPEAPDNMLMITGEWEPRLQGFAADAVAEAAPGVTREAIVAPAVEHVAILHSRAGRAAALDWLDRYYERASDLSVPQTGWALLILLAATTVLFAPLTRLAPLKIDRSPALSRRGFALAVGIPALAAPLIAWPLETKVLPVLVADYLAVHLLIYGLLQGGIQWYLRGRPRAPNLLGTTLLVVWTIGVFGFFLDRYGANFWPTPERFGIIAALALGAVPFMLADSWLVYGARFWRRLTARLGFLASLALAVTFDFEGLFFILLIAPVIVLFYLSIGSMGRAAAQRFGPMSAGLSLGLALAWALGVSFPLFSA